MTALRFPASNSVSASVAPTDQTRLGPETRFPSDELWYPAEPLNVIVGK